MAMYVNHNSASMKAQVDVAKTNRQLDRTFAKISSGLRITSAADDAAGLAVSSNLDSEVGSLRQAKRNTHDGISVVQTAEGATNEISEILKRMRELAVQSASETMADPERSYIQDEFKELSAEIDRISNVTEFNGVSLGNTSATLDVQVGVQNSSNDRITIQLGNLSASTLTVNTGAIGLDTFTNARTALTNLDNALNTVNGYRSDFGAVQNRLESALNNLENYTENIAGASSQIKDADFAHETADLAKYQIMQQAGVAVLGQANNLAGGALRLIG